MKKQDSFKQSGIFYLPVHPAEYVVTFMAIFFMVPVAMAVFNSPVNSRQQTKN